MFISLQCIKQELLIKTDSVNFASLSVVNVSKGKANIQSIWRLRPFFTVKSKRKISISIHLNWFWYFVILYFCRTPRPIMDWMYTSRWCLFWVHFFAQLRKRFIYLQYFWNTSSLCPMFLLLQLSALYFDSYKYFWFELHSFY